MPAATRPVIVRDRRLIPGYVGLRFKLQFATRIAEAEDRAKHCLVVADPHLVSVFCRPGAARGNGFVAVPAHFRGPLQPFGVTDLHQVLAAFVADDQRAMIITELDRDALKLQIVTLKLIRFPRP